MERTTKEMLRQFWRLCELEPRLRDLYEHVCAVEDGPAQPRFCAHDWWYGRPPCHGFKQELSDLIGWGRKQDPSAPRELATSAAYDCAYTVLYNLLPDCRNCGEPDF